MHSKYVSKTMKVELQCVSSAILLVIWPLINSAIRGQLLYKSDRFTSVKMLEGYTVA
jgi:hypothetical protein